MKLSALASTILATKMLMAGAQTVANSTLTTNSCYEPCETLDEYCEVSTGVCRGPSYDGECFNPATSAFQHGCDPGFECIDAKCDYQQEEAEAASNSEAGCGTHCDEVGEFCDIVLNECRAPSDRECYNTVTNVFQEGCDEGFECINNMCQMIITAPSDHICYLICSAGSYCENGTDECRGPNYDSECFNPATGLYQNGCDRGFICANNRCEYA